MSFIRRAPTESDILASHKSSMTKLTRSGKATPQTPSSSRHVMIITRRHNTLPSATKYVAWMSKPWKSTFISGSYFTIGFACWAGIQVITGQEFDGLANKNEIWKAATDLASKEYLSKNPEVRRRIESRDQILSAIYPSRAGSKTTRSEVTILPDSPDADDPELLSDLLSACCVSGDTAETSLASSTTTPRELGPHLIDKTVRYHDQETGKIMELTIQDCGTSHLKGEWFEVEYDDLTVLQITAGELKEILANCVDQ
ncbi:hypothetical protein JOM56_008279 [Amanita muscaria]